LQQIELAIYILMVAGCCLIFGNQAQAADPEAITKKVLCHTCLMKIYVAEANIAQATAEYQELFKLTPNDAALHFDYGNFLARNGKPELAVPQFKLAAKLKPSVPEYQVGLGNSLMYTKDYAGAVAAYNKACALGGKYQELVQKAQLYQAQQKSYEQYKERIQARKDADE
jgi:predicted Zn-dependent protease